MKIIEIEGIYVAIQLMRLVLTGITLISVMKHKIYKQTKKRMLVGYRIHRI